jgi:SAM-dependent methyltransferase
VTEHIPCPLCGSWNHQPLFLACDRLVGQPGAFPVVRCARCTLVFLNPRPAADALARFYPATYYPLDGRPTPEARAIAAGLLARVTSWLDTTCAPAPRLLDVGCGTGLFLHLAQERGLDVEGIELSPSAVAYARENYGLQVQEGTLASATLPESSFHVVTMWHVLEHLPDPVAALRAIERALVPGGLLLVGVPNVASVEARLFGRRWFSLDAPRHLVHFAPETLGQALEGAGYTVERIVQSDGTAGLVYSVMGDIHGILERLGRGPLSDRTYQRVARTLDVPAKPLCRLVAAGGYGGALEGYALKMSGEAPQRSATGAIRR